MIAFIIPLIVNGMFADARALGATRGVRAQRLAVPSYFYPGPAWQQLETAAGTVGVAVVNPNSGPGTTSNPDYVGEVKRAREAGITVIGYVHTSWGARSASVVRREIDLYYKWYAVDGIYLDEASTDCSKQPYYERLSRYIDRKGGMAVSVLGAGTTMPECYIRAGDVLLTFEGTYQAYAAWVPSGWEFNYGAKRFWHLVYSATDSEMASTVSLSKTRNAGWIYVTPDDLPNPWDTLPPNPYWTEELTAVEADP